MKSPKEKILRKSIRRLNLFRPNEENISFCKWRVDLKHLTPMRQRYEDLFNILLKFSKHTLYFYRRIVKTHVIFRIQIV